MATGVADADDSVIEATLAARLAASRLDGDDAGGDLLEAARFLLAAARQRQPGEPVVAVASVAGALGKRLTRIAAINDDMPFLVDSLAAAVGAMGLGIDLLFHPVARVTRDRDGVLRAIGRDEDGAPAESMIYIEAERADARTRTRLRAEIESTLADVTAAVADWPRLQRAMNADADALERGGPANWEPAELLRWFSGGRLTLLGHVQRRRDGTQGQALGVCRASADAMLSDDSYRRAFALCEVADAPPLLIIKANRISQVHRRAPLDLFIVPVREGREVAALSVHAGIWTSAALAAPPAQVPVLRRHVATIMARLGLDPQGHAGKALVHALTALPHDVLIAFDDAELQRIATTMMSLVDRPRTHLALLRSPLDRHLHAFVWLPRDALSTDLRQEALAMIAGATGATVLDWSLAVDGSLATIRAVLDLREGAPHADEAALGAALRTLVRGWPEAVETALAQTELAGRAAAIAARFADAFPLSYRTGAGAAEAAADIARLNRLGDGPAHRARDARLRGVGAPGRDGVRLKLYQHRGMLPLSDAVPMLENFGLRVAVEEPTVLGEGEGALGAIHDFQLELSAGLSAAAVLARAAEVEPAIAGVLNGAGENDAFNRLIVSPGLSVREAGWLRAIYRYLRQTGMSYGIGTVVDALAAAPGVTRGLVALFAARHDPALATARETAIIAARDVIRDGLAQVGAINDDRLLRRMQGVIEAIVRTNAFATARPGEGEIALAFKLDSAAVPELPRPAPWREIFVYSPRVEGIHLRAGPVARGGLRWSDRRDDFRTEVLGLMKAQRVKNAVIVPTGAKGGFYPKRLPDPARDRDAWMAEGTESYRVFVRSLLSLTDNLVGGRVVHPAGVVIHDGDDPYFVVAADKGTATFSDVANAIAAERDFWLDDAFASGGSNGYDHKAMAITAKGAWLSVRRHFVELGVDVQSEPVRVAGCGDMSGDVFGNGMLLSHAIKLVAAFDHRHIFLDPDPDPARGYDERKRLFGLPRSSWDDYDKTLLSKGGGVFARTMKAIPLSPQARALTGLAAESVDPETLIRAILTAPVDLLWLGGIGTYVKAVGESNAVVGDPANDALRVDGRAVRARVIGEGANLGVTQAGRIEFALTGASGTGGRINTDFIDNSAGVDCSDHEVNIKIALASARRAGRLDEPGRVVLLRRMTDEVAGAVLEDNRLQALALSIAERGGPDAVPAFVRLIEVLEDAGQIDRRGDGLADADSLARRASDGRGLTRPELAVVLSSAKLALQAAFEARPLPDDPAFADVLLAAFPATMRGSFADDIAQHRLRREIVATALANRIVNRLGVIHPFELLEVENAGADQLAAAFVAAERLFDMGAIWRDLDTGTMPEPARIALFDRAAAALRPHIADLLRDGAGGATPSRLVAELGDGVAQLGAVAANTLAQESRVQSGELRAELAAVGAPARLAGRVADLFDLDGAIGIARLARLSGADAVGLAAAFVDLAARLGLDWAQGKAARMNPRDPWERLLVANLARDFQQLRIQFLARIAAGGGDPRAAVARWGEDQAAAVAQFRAIVRRAQGAAVVTPALLAQLAGQARALLAR